MSLSSLTYSRQWTHSIIIYLGMTEFLQVGKGGTLFLELPGKEEFVQNVRRFDENLFCTKLIKEKFFWITGLLEVPMQRLYSIYWQKWLYSWISAIENWDCLTLIFLNNLLEDIHVLSCKSTLKLLPEEVPTWYLDKSFFANVISYVVT